MSKIIGNTTATPNPQSDWNQNDSTRADYIKNKPDIQDKLPVNTSGSSSRVWVATNNKYKINGTKAKGVEIGFAEFTSKVTFQKVEGSDSEYTCKITTSGFTPKSDASYAMLARVAELYVMADDQGTAGAYADYIRAIPTSSGTGAYFYWTYPYYFKRMSAEMANGDSTTATSANAYTGIVTVSNFFDKWKNGEINAGTPYADYAGDYKKYLLNYYLYNVCGEGKEPTAPSGIKFSFFNATDNEEPFPQTIATRSPNGQLTVESGSLPFHAVNVKQLDKAKQDIEKKITDATTKVGKSLSVSFTQTTEDTWITVASMVGGSHRSALFNFQATGTSGDTTFVTALIESHESNGYKTNIVVFSATDRIFTSGQRRCIKGIRVVAPSQKSTDSSVYLQVKVRDLVSRINVSSIPLNNSGIWTLGNSLQPSNGVTYTNYECNLESTLILSDITRSTAEINEGSYGPKGDKGDPGPKGDAGDPGPTGSDGESAYEIACRNGYEGTEAEWLNTLSGYSIEVVDSAPSSSNAKANTIYFIKG